MDSDSDDDNWQYIPLWKSKSRNYYPTELILTVQDERYDTDTETIVSTEQYLPLRHRTHIGDFLYKAVYLNRRVIKEGTLHISY